MDLLTLRSSARAAAQKLSGTHGKELNCPVRAGGAAFSRKEVRVEATVPLLSPPHTKPYLI